MRQTAVEFMEWVTTRTPGETEFHQAVDEVVSSIWPVLERRPAYAEAKILERMVEPERVISFRVPWVDDGGQIQVNRGYRVEMNSAIGPYKGGLRFRGNVNLSVLKFLAFEQTLKNALTTLPLGGGKGGSDFDPKGRSDGEVMRFCQAFMSELFRHIGSHTDVPAGDIGVGAREVGFLFGQYKRLANEFTGVLTGKGPAWGGSNIRPEATGYGVVYFAEQMLKTRDESIYRKACLISGSGNVAQYAAENVIRLGGKVLTMSDSSGFVYDPDGIDDEKLAWIIDLKEIRRGRISEYADHFGCDFHAGQRPWAVEDAQVALPCASSERAQPGGSKDAAGQRRVRRRRRRQHALGTRRRTPVRRRRDPLRSGQGRQRRWCGCQRAGDGAERDLLDLEPRPGRRPPAGHHGRHPRQLCPSGR